MPYISQEERKRFKALRDLKLTFESKGQLEYAIYYLMNRFMSTREERYTPQHDCVYAAAHCAHEFERRRLDGREDAAKEKNGDIEV